MTLKEAKQGIEKELGTLKKKLEESKSERKNYKMLLKEAENHKAHTKKQLEEAKRLLLRALQGYGSKFKSNAGQDKEEHFKREMDTIEKARQLLQRQPASQIDIISTTSPNQSQTTITTTIHSVRPESRSKKQKAQIPYVASSPSTTPESEINSSERSEREHSFEEDLTEALLRDLFFPFSSQ